MLLSSFSLKECPQCQCRVNFPATLDGDSLLLRFAPWRFNLSQGNKRNPNKILINRYNFLQDKNHTAKKSNIKEG
jgi:hypothetical protein